MTTKDQEDEDEEEDQEEKKIKSETLLVEALRKMAIDRREAFSRFAGPSIVLRCESAHFPVRLRSPTMCAAQSTRGMARR